MIKTLLIANRGEIACRISRCCREMGIRTVAVYSDADKVARHVLLADEAVHIGAAPASESYLNIDRILAAAQKSGADAVHPGYGFLAENAAFARACNQASLTFVGPPPGAIEAMGNKRQARALMQAAGVPVLPGSDKDALSDDQLMAAAAEVGFPLIVKAAEGGGGRGMRFVERLEDLPGALTAARREALRAFGSDELFIERVLTCPRHIEFQILADAYGHVVHLGERECSIQRRFQKVIEEAPAISLANSLRERMGAAAVSAARAINYANAGTVEFLLDEEGDFYFLEFNTRIQVEHPVTEMTTGLDLVGWQIRIAEGEPLTISQDEVQFDGHALEARTYAERPDSAFAPASGPVILWQPPKGVGLRIESGLLDQDIVPVHYDAMLAKVIAHGPDRSAAIRRLARALENTVLLGLDSNLAFLRAILDHPDFLEGSVHTGWLEGAFRDWREPVGDVELALIVTSLIQFHRHPQLESNSGYWRNNPNRPLRYRYQGQPDVTLIPEGRQFRTTLGGRECLVEEFQSRAHRVAVTLDGYRRQLVYAQSGERWWLKTPSGVVSLRSQPLLPEPKQPAGASGSLRAPVPGEIIEVLVEVGQRVTRGQALMKLEAMKMEHTIRGAADGLVQAIYYQAGDRVEADAQLLEIVADS